MRDLDQASRFMATQSRLLDRRRFDLLFGGGTVEGALAALAAYRNADGGYGSGLEPDLRSTSSQPVSALHAFEVLEDISPDSAPESSLLCDWLGSITLPDGGLPFGLPIADPAGCAPFFTDVDPDQSSLHMTSMLAAIAHRIAGHDEAVRDHSWVATATDYSLRRIRGLDGPGHALELRYAMAFLDSVHDSVPGADDELRRLRTFIPASGSSAVEGGAEDEVMGVLDFAPEPGRPVRALFSETAIEAALDRLVAEQRDDGGWTVDWGSFSAAGALEWRGWATVRALKILRSNDRGNGPLT